MIKNRLRKFGFLLCSIILGSQAMTAEGIGWEPVKLRSIPYPRMLQLARVSGLVKLQISLSDNGTVEAVKATSGHPLLANAASKAVETWLFRRTCQSGDLGNNQLEMEWRFVLEGSCRGNNCKQTFEVLLPATVTVTSEIPGLEE